jgi:hypothetical protein
MKFVKDELVACEFGIRTPSACWSTCCLDPSISGSI